VKIDFDKKEASFTIKANNNISAEDVKKKVGDTGRGTVVSIKAA
jgi:hypothetical protein